MTVLEQKWRSTGLLETYECGSKEAETLSHNLQSCVDFLLGNEACLDTQYIEDTLYLILRKDDKPKDEYLAGMLLPIIVRLQMDRNITNIDIRRLYYCFLKYSKAWKTKCVGVSMLDEEAEMCSDFARDF